MGGQLRFNHAHPNMCHSPKVVDGVDPFFLRIFIEELLTAIYPKPSELLT
jgi:hypothetical protein